MPENKSNSVDPEITDSVTQADTLTLGTAHSFSNAAASISMAESVGLLMLGAVNTYQNARITSNAAVSMGCTRLLQAGLITDANANTDVNTNVNTNINTNAAKPTINPSVAKDISNHVDRLANQAINLMDKTSEHYEPAKNALNDLVSRLSKSETKPTPKKASKKTSSKK